MTSSSQLSSGRVEERSAGYTIDDVLQINLVDNLLDNALRSKRETPCEEEIDVEWFFAPPADGRACRIRPDGRCVRRRRRGGVVIERRHGQDRGAGHLEGRRAA